MKKFRIIALSFMMFLAIAFFNTTSNVSANPTVTSNKTTGFSIAETFSDPALQGEMTAILKAEDASVIITDELADSITSISLVGKDIVDISGLEIFKNLEKLDLKFNEISVIPNGIFTNMNNLRELNLLSNRLTDLPEDFKDSLSSLKVLDLSHNWFDHIPLDKLENKKLTTLKMRFNHLTSIPSELANQDQLSVLDLSINEIPSLPKEFYTLINLTDLNLEQNKISGVTDDLGKLVNLQYLVFTNNRLGVVPDGIKNLVNLVELYVGGNCLYDLPDHFDKMPNLRHFDAQFNVISKFPLSFAKLRKGVGEPLIRINMNMNEISEVPAIYKDLVSKEFFISLHFQIIRLDTLTWNPSIKIDNPVNIFNSDLPIIKSVSPDGKINGNTVIFDNLDNELQMHYFYVESSLDPAVPNDTGEGEYSFYSATLFFTVNKYEPVVNPENKTMLPNTGSYDLMNALILILLSSSSILVHKYNRY